MGWSAGYTALEACVVAVYNKDILDKALMEAIIEPFRDTDCDSAGSMDLKAKDGLGMEEIICKIMEPEKYQEVKQNPGWYPGEEPDSGHHHGWSSSGAGYDLFRSIWYGRWGIC